MSYTSKSGKLIEDLPTAKAIAKADRRQLVIWRRTMRPSYSKEDIATKRAINMRLVDLGGKHITMEEAEEAGVGYCHTVIRKKRNQGIS